MKPSVETEKQIEGKLKIGQRLGIVAVGGNVLNPKFIFILVMGALEQVMHFHGFYESWPDVAYICNSMAIYCLILQLAGRLGSKLTRGDDDNALRLVQNVISFYEREEKIPSHREILVRNLQISRVMLDGYLLVCFILFNVPNSTAWILSWYSEDYLLFSPIYLPFINPKTLIGYIINSALLYFYTMLVYTLFMSSDSIFMYLVTQCITMIDIYCFKLRHVGEELIKIKTEKLNENLQLETSTSLTNIKKIVHQKALEHERTKKVLKVEQKLIDLIKEFQSYNEYVQSITQFIEFTVFVAMTLNSMAIAMLMIVTLHYSKAIGGVIVIFLFFQVLIPCVQGSLITKQKEKLLNELFAFPWYELSLSKQKTFLQMIHLCQNSNEFRIQIIGIVDMQLFTGVMNGVYSYLMYLLKFDI